MPPLMQQQRPTLLDRVFRTCFWIGFRLARVWWSVRRKSHQGALVHVAVPGRFLLLRSSYRRDLNFAGGGVRKGEEPAAAALRELHEELGMLDVPQAALRHVCTLSSNWDGRPDRVHFFRLDLDAVPLLRLDNREIVEARFVSDAAPCLQPLTGPVAAYAARHIAAAVPAAAPVPAGNTGWTAHVPSWFRT